jgi:hypothetical protein
MQPSLTSFKNLLTVIAIVIFSVFTACQKSVSNSPGQDEEFATTSSQSNAANTTTSIIDLDLTANPFPFPIIVPCANGGAGEEIIPQGNVRQLSHLTINGNHYTIKFQYTPQGVIATGQITGDIYQGVGVGEFTETGSFVNGKATLTSVWMFTNIGRAGAPNWKLIPTVHTTINANGTITASVDNLVASCN